MAEDIDEIEKQEKLEKEEAEAKEKLNDYWDKIDEVKQNVRKYYKQVKDLERNQKITGRSIVASGRHSIFYFPVFCSNSLTINEAHAIAKMYERVYADFVQNAISQRNRIVKQTDFEDLKFLKQYHTNIINESGYPLDRIFGSEALDKTEQMIYNSCYNLLETCNGFMISYQSDEIPDEDYIAEHKRNISESLTGLSYIKEADDNSSSDSIGKMAVAQKAFDITAKAQNDIERSLMNDLIKTYKDYGDVNNFTPEYIKELENPHSKIRNNDWITSNRKIDNALIQCNQLGILNDDKTINVNKLKNYPKGHKLMLALTNNTKYIGPSSLNSINNENIEKELQKAIYNNPEYNLYNQIKTFLPTSDLSNKVIEAEQNYTQLDIQKSEIEDKIKELKDSQKQINDEYKKAADKVTDVDYKINKLDENDTQFNTKLLKLKKEKHQAENEEKDARDKKNNVDKELNTLSSKLSTMDDKLKKAQATIDTNKKLANTEFTDKLNQQYNRKKEADNAFEMIAKGHNKTLEDIKKLNNEFKNDLAKNAKQAKWAELSLQRKSALKQAAASAGTKQVQMIKDTDIKKINGMLPYNINIELWIEPSEANRDLRAINLQIGIKTVLHLVDPNDLEDELDGIMGGSKKRFDKIRLQTGEINWLQYIFKSDENKRDLKKTYSKNKNWIQTLKKLGKYKDTYGSLFKSVLPTLTGFQRTNAPIPNATMVLTAIDVDNIKLNTGYDFSKESVVSKFASQMFIIAFVIVDSSTRTIKTLYPGETSRWDLVALDTIEDLIARSSNQDFMKELKRSINR